MSDILLALDRLLADRKSASPDDSYVASLNSAGLNKILEKVGEEATEVILAAKDAQESGNTEALTPPRSRCPQRDRIEGGSNTDQHAR